MFRLFLTTLAVTALAGTANAAVINGSLVSTTSGNLNVTLTDNDPLNDPDLGNLDWNVWVRTGSGPSYNVTPSDQKLGGTAIGALSVLGSPDVGQGGGGADNRSFNWVDGTNTAVASPSTNAIRELFNTDNGEGFSLDITLPAGDSTVTLFVGIRNGTASLVASSGTTTLYNSADENENISNSGSNNYGRYVLDISNAVPNELLTVDFTRVSGQTGEGRLRLYGAAVSVIPEPASLALVGLGSLLMLGRDRRQHV